jgi:hypothetical protein
MRIGSMGLEGIGEMNMGIGKGKSDGDMLRSQKNY